nr:hypothetical protein [Clostridioides sp.]
MRVLAVDIIIRNNEKDIITLVGADGLDTNSIMQFEICVPYETLAKELKTYIDLGEYEKIIISNQGINVSLSTKLEQILKENEIVIEGYRTPLDRQESILNLFDTEILDQLDIKLKLSTHYKNEKSYIALDDGYYWNKRKTLGIIRSLKLINDFYINNK